MKKLKLKLLLRHKNSSKKNLLTCPKLLIRKSSKSTEDSTNFSRRCNKEKIRGKMPLLNRCRLNLRRLKSPRCHCQVNSLLSHFSNPLRCHKLLPSRVLFHHNSFSTELCVSLSLRNQYHNHMMMYLSSLSKRPRKIK